MSEYQKAPPEGVGEEIKKKSRYDKEKRLVEIVETPEDRERLEYLREQSTVLNKILQEKFEEAGLPYYTWNKRSKKAQTEKKYPHPKVLRLGLMLRPEYYGSAEEKNAETRYTTGDEQITTFLHIKKDGEIQTIRYHSGLTQSANGLAFEWGIFPDVTKEKNLSDRQKLDELIRKNDLEGLADYMVNRLDPSSTEEIGRENSRSFTLKFQKAYGIEDVEQAREYFADGNLFFWQAPEITRNLAKVVISSILEKTLFSQLGKEKDLEVLRGVLERKAEDIIQVSFKQGASLRRSGMESIGSVVPDVGQFIKQTIQSLIKFYKPDILGWSKNKK